MKESQAVYIKVQIDVFGCFTAAGQVIPTMVVFSGKSCNHTLSGGEAGFHLGGGIRPPPPPLGN